MVDPAGDFFHFDRIHKISRIGFIPKSLMAILGLSVITDKL